MSGMPPVNPAADRGRLIPLRGDPPSAVQRPAGTQSVKAEFVTSAIPRKAPSVQEAATVVRAQVEMAAQKIQNFANSLGKGINFVVDTSSGRAVIRVTDPSTNETIRQIPPEESLRIAQVVDYLSSLLVSQRA